MKKHERRIGEIDEYFLIAKKGEVYDKAIAGVDRLLIEEALERTLGNQVQAAKILGINRNTIHYKIIKLNIDIERFKR